MGMFDKDKEVGILLTRYIEKREEFILWDARITREDFPTDLGPTPQTALTISRKGDPGTKTVVTTLASAIAAKVREAESGDLPAVVFWTTAPSRYGGDATVLQFVRPHGTTQDNPHVDNDPGPVVPAPAE
jgi:hypothetical protein